MFSWNSRSSKVVPPNRHSSSNTSTNCISRQQHLQSYLNHPTLKPSTRRVNPSDDSTYDTVFATKSGHALMIRVTYAQGGTLRTNPEIYLYGVEAEHRWIDSSQQHRVIGYPNINTVDQWANSEETLGHAVAAIVKHLQLNPPTVSLFTNPALLDMQNKSVVSQTRVPKRANQPLSPPAYETAVEEDFDINIPPIPTEFPELEFLSKDEMKQLVDDEDIFQAFLQTKVTNIQEFLQSNLEGTYQSAKNNLEQESELLALHTEATNLHQLLTKKGTVFATLTERQELLTERPDKRLVVRKLMVAKKEIDDESEDMASSYVNGDLTDVDINEFIRTYTEKRILYHIRNAKIERLRVG